VSAMLGWGRFCFYASVGGWVFGRKGENPFHHLRRKDKYRGGEVEPKSGRRNHRVTRTLVREINRKGCRNYQAAVERGRAGLQLSKLANLT